MRRAAAILLVLAVAGCDRFTSDRHYEAAAIRAMQTLVTAQSLHCDRTKAYAPALAALGTANLIDSTLATGTKMGYAFKILGAGPKGWAAVATPLVPGKTGDRAFFVDESGVIRFTADGTAPTAQSTPVGL